MRERKPMHETIYAVFGAAMALVYIALGMVFLFSSLGGTVFPEQLTKVFGTAIIGYGIFRIYRAIKQMAQ